jgi:Methyltransferase domain
MLNALSHFPANPFYSSAPIQSLFARELRAITPILSGIYGNCGLFLRAHAQTPVALPPHLLVTMVDLALEQGVLQGAARCLPGQLPFVSEGFKLVIAQHVFEQIQRPDECAAELARVLAPEGVALILGFNPAGSWRPWLSLAAPGAPRLRLRSASVWQQMLAREQVDTLQVRYPGLLWPRAEQPRSGGTPDSAVAAPLGRIGSSWLLLARKRRSTLTPVRLRSASRELAMNPRLAPGANRVGP